MVVLIQNIIPVHIRDELEELVERDLKGATILSSNPHVDEDGSIILSEIIIRLQDGRELTIEATCESNMVLRLETNIGWRDFNAIDDYGYDDNGLEPWTPDPPEPWDQ